MHTYIYIGIAAAILILTGIILFLCLHKKKQGVNVDQEFIETLLNALGSKENILEYNVENARVKFKVSDLDKADLEKLKELSPRGVFITGNEIKTLFKYESKDIVAMLNKVIK